VLSAWKARVRELRVEVHALYLACRDPRVPWYAKALAAGVVAYAFSPIDLIPDPIPLLGQLDDLVLLPLGVLVARRMIPPQVLAEARNRAREMARVKPVSWTAAAVVVAIWIVLAVAVVFWAMRRLSSPPASPDRSAALP
jgi:uncharacterized membrane protein YkvA (DUF1232 family)